MIDQKALRLELLKLTYAHGRDSAEAVRRAKELEAYCNESPEPVQPPVVDKPVEKPAEHAKKSKKKPDNVDLM